MGKFTKENIERAVASSKSYCEVCRNLGARDWGGSYYNIKNRILRYNFDTSHFDRSAHCKNKPSRNRETAEYFLVLDETRTHRQKTVKLVRSLLEIGREYVCEICNNLGIWLDKELILQVDHINGNWQDNRQENLRFLCPNCHSQTENFRNK